MRRFLAFVAVVVVISTAVGVALVIWQRRRLAQMSDEELRAFLEEKLGERVPPGQLSVIQDAVVAKVRGRRRSSSSAVTGAITYRERIAMPADAVTIVELLDTSRMDAPLEQLGAQVIDDAGSVPMPYSVDFDRTKIVESHSYSVRATISAGDQLLWTTDTDFPVITRGNPMTADLLLVAVPQPVSE